MGMRQSKAAVRLVDTAAYVSAMRSLVEEGHEASMLVCGSSMSPFLVHLRDTVYFRRPDRLLRAGDIVFYRRDCGQYVMHRILRVRGDGYDLAGDAQTQVERGVRRDQIFAIVTRVRRKGRLVGPGNFWWTFFACVWTRLLALRPVIVRAYGRLIRIIR